MNDFQFQIYEALDMMFKLNKVFNYLSLSKIDQTMYSGCANTVNAINPLKTVCKPR